MAGRGHDRVGVAEQRLLVRPTVLALALSALTRSGLDFV